MSQTFDARVRAVDHSLLTPLVRQALHSPDAMVLDWEQRPLGGGAANPAEGVLSRIHFLGRARVQDEVVPWSLVLKAFAPPPAHANDDQTVWTYWKREVLAYQSGILADLGGGLVAPDCFAVDEYPDEEYWVWMEYISEEHQQWPLARYQMAARHLGQFNGTSLLRRPLPAYPWLNNGHLRQWIEMGEPGLQKRLHLTNHSSWLADEHVARTSHLYNVHSRLLAALDQLPHCLCHHDLHRRNLLARQTSQGEERTVAIDWSAIGLGTIGEEIAHLVGGSLFFLDVPATDTNRLDELVFAGYLAGLQDVGWRGDEAMVRLGYAAATALLVTLSFTGIMLMREEDESFWIGMEQFIGRPRVAIQDAWRAAHRLGLALGDEALTLLNRGAV